MRHLNDVELIKQHIHGKAIPKRDTAGC